MFTPEQSQGYQLLKAAGTFLSKYYPYRSEAASIMHSQEQVAAQLEYNLTEAKNVLSYAHCPLTHTELWYMIPLQEQTTFLTANLPGLIAGAPYQTISTPVANDPTFPSFTLPSKITHIAFLQDRIVNPTVVYKNDIDYIVANEKIMFLTDPGNADSLWGKNVEFDIDYLYNAVGFIFLSKADCKTEEARYIIQLLLYMFRYGMTNKKLLEFCTIFFGFPYLKSQETIVAITSTEITTDKNTYTYTGNPVVEVTKSYPALTPLTDNVTIDNATDTEYYTHNGNIETHRYTTKRMIWGEFTLGSGRWGDATYTEDKYYKILQQETIYVVNINSYSPLFSLSYLKHLAFATPVWLKLNIHIKDAFRDLYNSVTDTCRVYRAIHPVDSYISVTDGSLRTVKWGEKRWGEFILGTASVVNDIILLDQPQ